MLSPEEQAAPEGLAREQAAEEMPSGQLHQDQEVVAAEMPVCSGCWQHVAWRLF